MKKTTPMSHQAGKPSVRHGVAVGVAGLSAVLCGVLGVAAPASAATGASARVNSSARHANTVASAPMSVSFRVR